MSVDRPGLVERLEQAQARGLTAAQAAAEHGTTADYVASVWVAQDRGDRAPTPVARSSVEYVRLVDLGVSPDVAEQMCVELRRVRNGRTQRKAHLRDANRRAALRASTPSGRIPRALSVASDLTVRAS